MSGTPLPVLVRGNRTVKLGRVLSVLHITTYNSGIWNIVRVLK